MSALMLGGAQGIGKDTLLEPVKHAVGLWNFVEVSPNNIVGRFNGFRFTNGYETAAIGALSPIA